MYSTLANIPSSHWQSYDYISLDFFDTLVERTRTENSIIIEALKLDLHSKGVMVDELEFLAVVEKASTSCRNQLVNQGLDSEATLDEIYQNVFQLLNIPRAYFNQFLSTRKALEVQNLKLKKGARKWLIALIESGKKVIISSDTYYQEEQFNSFFNALELDGIFYDVFLSCSYRLNKASGRLYSSLLKKYELKPCELLHIGDNAFSDISVAKQLGIDAIQVDGKVIISQQEKETQLYQFGYQVLAPLIGVYMRELKSYVIEHNISRLNFMARDGYLLYQASQYYFNNDVMINYVYLNRVICNQLNTNSLSREALINLSIKYPAHGIDILVFGFGLQNTDFSKYFDAWLSDNQIAPSKKLSTEAIELFVKNKQLNSSFFKSIKQKREQAKSYLNFIAPSSEKVAFIDVGWRGSIFRQLQSLPESEQFYGYLLACIDNIGNGLGAFSCDTDKHGQMNHQLAELRECIEYFCAEESSICIGFDEQYQPIYSEAKVLGSQGCRQLIQQGVLDKLSLAEKYQVKWCPEKVIKEFVSFNDYLSEELKSVFSSLSVSTSLDDNKHQSLGDFVTSLKLTDNKGLKNMQSGIYQFLAFTKSLDKTGENICLFGAGSGCQLLLPHLAKSDVFICDSNKELHGEKIDHTVVYPIDKLSEYTEENLTIVITVIGRKKQLSQLLSPFKLPLVFLEDYLW